MKHFIYKTTHKNGKYYIGRHSTSNQDDGYMGSGLWTSSIKDKSTLTREILEYVDTFEHLVALEDQYLLEHYGKPNCMNMSNKSTGWAVGLANPMNKEEVKSKFQGDKHWLRKNPSRVEEFKHQQIERVKQGTHNFLGNKNPNKDGRNAKQAMKNGKHNSITNNPSTVNAKNGTHHWQQGRSPNAGGKLNKKLVAAGTHNFLGPELNNKRIKEGTHNLMGADSNLKRLAAGTHPSQQKLTCACGKIVSIGMFKRWHGNNCKQLKETTTT